MRRVDAEGIHESVGTEMNRSSLGCHCEREEDQGEFRHRVRVSAFWQRHDTCNGIRLCLKISGGIPGGGCRLLSEGSGVFAVRRRDQEVLAAQPRLAE